MSNKNKEDELEEGEIIEDKEESIEKKDKS